MTLRTLDLLERTLGVLAYAGLVAFLVTLVGACLVLGTAAALGVLGF